MKMPVWTKSKYPGIRFRESDTDFVGVGRSKRPRRYYVMTYKHNRKTKSEGLGWEGDIVLEKILNENTAHDICRLLSSNRRDKTPPFTLAELREENEQALEEAEKQAEVERLHNITFGEIFTDKYFPEVQHNRRNHRSIQREISLFNLWISPTLAAKPIQTIVPLHLEKIKKDMVNAGRSAGSIRYCLAVVRQVFNYALRNNFFTGKNPADKSGGVKRPLLDNRRTRFLTRQEAADLLKELTKRSSYVHDMALFSLHTGARAGEVFSLQWSDVDFAQGTAIFKDTKSGKNRAAFLTAEVKTMLLQRRPQEAAAASWVFPGRDGVKIVQISDSFTRAVNKLKLNEGVTDRRQRVTFHTLRHTFASWLAIDGINPFHLKELLGHSDLKLTERYSHLSESALREAALRIQQG
jgi:integrase